MFDDLTNVSIFKELNDDHLAVISTFSRKLELSDGEVLISENETESYDLFVLCRGKVEVVSSESGKTSDEVALSSHDKDIFGEIAWLRNGHRSATVRAMGDIEAIRIDGKSLKDFVFSNPQAGVKIVFAIAQTLAERLSNTDTLLKQLLWNAGI